MLNVVPTSDCTRAREAASARLDGELSELDAVRLDGHLGACPACRAYAAEIEAIAVGLRAQPLERPESRVIVSRRRRVPVQAAAAAAVILTAVAGSSFALGRAVNDGRSPARTVTASGVLLGGRSVTSREHLLAELGGFTPVPVGHRSRLITI